MLFQCPTAALLSHICTIRTLEGSCELVLLSLCDLSGQHNRRLENTKKLGNRELHPKTTLKKRKESMENRRLCLKRDFYVAFLFSTCKIQSQP
ncbi:hypothetical protein XENTR_v10016030 [Xenopus tropicalis]|nr:hypothetical protein XENTR_v10016030 [Xenopus tropicalis]